MWTELVNYCHCEYGELIKKDLNIDEKWKRDFGAEIIKNVIQSEFKEEDWPLYENEKTQIDIEGRALFYAAKSNGRFF